jgi:hypothetical protein
MSRFLWLVVVAGCAAEPALSADQLSETTSELGLSLGREHVSGDIYHYTLELPVGTTPAAGLRIHRVVRERAPWVPRPTARGAMFLHGDFSTFTTNFAPQLADAASPVAGLAPYLAARGVDVWGLDRRWTLPAAADDISDFAELGVATELADLRAALAIARSFRGGDRLALAGFSHGAQLAYTYAAVEGGRPPWARHVDALVALDFYGAFAPEDEALRTRFCEYSAFEYQLVAGGEIDSPNDFLIAVGELARSAPDEESPFFPGATNRDAMLVVAGQTYFFAPFAPFYHLAAPALDGDVVLGLSESREAAVASWFAGATPHQSLLETADLDALLCGEGPQPVDAPLSQIRTPLLYLGAAGGVGSLGLHTTTQVGSTDVTTHVVQRLPPERRAEDFGHGDLLYATDAPALAWDPLAHWLMHHRAR